MSDIVHNQDKPRPLEGVKVLEYGVFHAGPGCGSIFGDLGAEVIKIEAAEGDPIRYWTKIGGIDLATDNGESLMFEVSNRNKKGICLDIKTEKGRSVLNRLVKWADVFLTNLRKSTKSELGIDYAALSEINPTIIHANVSGYGPEGPMSDLGAFDPLGQARSGMMFVTGQPEPVLMHLGILDQATAIAASHAVLTALYVREKKGIGQEVHISLYSTALWLQYPNLTISNVLATNPCVPSDRRKHSPLRNRFRCKDGKWIIGAHHPENKYWATFCRATGQDDLLNDARFTDDSGRPAGHHLLIEIFDQVFVEKTRDEWMAIFQKHKLMFTSIQTIEEVQNDPQAEVNGYVAPFAHERFGSVRLPGYPVHFSHCSAGMRHAAPAIGQHTEDILRELGYSKNEIEELRREKVVV
jgi:crotonobetainyl-CoA:carnitine CoA-transferase CaiB-like acyl-CoA transferase